MTQAFIKAHSKAPHYNPATLDEHIPDTDTVIRDEVGLVRAIAVKVRSLYISQSCIFHNVLRATHQRNARISS
jgi:hypothetical protein